MKKDINEIVKIIKPETLLEKILSYCDTVEDFELIISKMNETKNTE